MWAEASFVLDANVLLNVYRYSDATRNEMFSLLESIKQRIWIPHRAGLEFQSNRIGVILQQAALYDRAAESASSLLATLRSSTSHPFVSEALVSQLGEVFGKLERELASQKLNLEGHIDTDPLRDRLTDLLDGRIGPTFSSERYSQIPVEVESRFKAKIPPGFKDNKKDDGGIGDAVIWLQVIEYAKETRRPVILVTDDGKEDWWQKVSGRTIGPRPELVEEIFNAAGVKYYQYSTDRLMHFSVQYLGSKVTQSAIDEVKAYHDDATVEAAEQELLATFSAGERVFHRLFGGGVVVGRKAENILVRFSAERAPRLIAARHLSSAHEKTMSDIFNWFTKAHESASKSVDNSRTPLSTVEIANTIEGAFPDATDEQVRKAVIALKMSGPGWLPREEPI